MVPPNYATAPSGHGSDNLTVIVASVSMLTCSELSQQKVGESILYGPLILTVTNFKQSIDFVKMCSQPKKQKKSFCSLFQSSSCLFYSKTFPRILNSTC